MTGVIVIGDHVQALGIIRSLGRRGIPVYLLHDKKLCIGRFSRYTKKFLVVPDDNDEIKFIDFLTRLAKNDLVKNWILMPTNDSWAHILSKNKEALEVYYRVPTPSWDILKFAYNKRLTFSIAEKKSVPFPKSIFPDSKEDIYDRIDELSFPVIIKGVIGLKFYRNMGFKALKAESKEELFEYYNTQDIDPKETIIQKVIVFPGFIPWNNRSCGLI